MIVGLEAYLSSKEAIFCNPATGLPSHKYYLKIYGGLGVIVFDRDLWYLRVEQDAAGITRASVGQVGMFAPYEFVVFPGSCHFFYFRDQCFDVKMVRHYSVFGQTRMLCYYDFVNNIYEKSFEEVTYA